MHRRVLTAALVLLTALVAGMFASSTPTRAQETARVTILHLAPFAEGVANTAVTVVVGDTVVDNDFRYKDEPLVANLPGGTYTVNIFAGANADTSGTPAITGSVTIEGGRDYTVFAGGDGTNIPLGLFPLVDDTAAPGADQAKVRIVHAAPFAPQANTGVDIRLADQSAALVRADLTGVEFGQFSDPYVSIPAAATDLAVNVTTVGGATTIIGPIPANLPDQTIASIFAIGGANNYPAEVIVVPGRIVAQPEPARVTILHLAPFAEGVENTAVTLVVNGSVIDPDFRYKDEPIITDLPGGTYTVEVFAGANADTSGTPAITGSVTIEGGRDYTVFAGGDGTNIPLGLFPLVDDTTAPGADQAKVRIVHAAPFAEQDQTGVDIRSNAEGNPLVRADLTGVEFGQFSDPYVTLPANAAGLAVNVTAVGGTPTIIGPIPATLPDQTIASVFAIGGANGFAPEAIVVPGRVVPTEPEPAQLRVVHAAPFAPGAAAVDVVVPTVPPLTLLPNFSFGQTSQDYDVPAPFVGRPGGFIELPAATYPIEIRPAGTDTAAISGSFTLEAGTRYTALALGGANGYDLEVDLIEEPAGPPAEGKARIRVYHAAPFAEDLADTAVSIRTQDRSAVVGGLSNVQYKGTAVIEVDPGTYDLVIATPNGSATLIDIPPFTVAAGDELMIIAVGDGVVTDGAAPAQTGPNQPLRTIFLGTQSTFRLYFSLIGN
jgi:hypothetical protein